MSNATVIPPPGDLLARIHRQFLDMEFFMSLITEVIWIMNPDMELLYISPSVEHVYHMSAEQLLARPLDQQFSPESHLRLKQAIEEEWAREVPGPMRPVHSILLELEQYDGRGKLFWTELKANFLRDETGKPLGAIGLTRDISEQKRMNHEQTVLLRALFDSTDETMALLDRNGNFVAINQSGAKRFGVTPSEMVGTCVYDWLGESRELRKRMIEQVIKTGLPVSFADQRNQRHFEQRFVPVFDDQGRVEKIAAFAKDITEFLRIEQDLRDIQADLEARVQERTADLMEANQNLAQEVLERRRMQVALQQSEERFRNLITLLPEVVYEVDSQGMVSFVNEKGLELFGYSRQEFADNFEFFRLVVSEERDKARQSVASILRGNDSGWVEYTGLRKDGSTFPMMSHSTVSVSQGKLIGLRGIVIDLTEKKKMEEALLAREAILKAVSAAAETFLKEPANKQTIRECLGRLGRATGADQATFFANETMADGQVETVMNSEWTKLGEGHFMVHALVPRFSFALPGFDRFKKQFEQGQIISGRVEDLLRGNLALTDEIAHISIMAVPVFVGKNWLGFICFSNLQTMQTFSNAALEALKAAASILGAAIERDRAESAKKESERVFSTLIGNLPGMAYRCQHDPNRHLEFASEGCQSLLGFSPCDLVGDDRISFGQIIHPEDRQSVWKTINEQVAKGEPYQLLYRVNTSQDQVRWVWEQGCGVFNGEDKAHALEGYILDITERRRMEMEIEENAREIEMYNDILAHDIGNINQTTLNNINLLACGDCGTINEEQKSLLAACKRQIHRTSSLIEKVKTVNKLRQLSDDPCVTMDLCALIRMAVKAARSITKDKTVVVHFALKEKRKVNADKLIHQLFYNLVENAIVHVKNDEVHIDISISEAEHKSKPAWKIGIADNGPGIPDERKSVIFERFVKGRQQVGSGMGLTIVRALTEKYDGRIWVEDKVKGDYTQGARFVTVLPQAKAFVNPGVPSPEPAPR